MNPNKAFTFSRWILLETSGILKQRMKQYFNEYWTYFLLDVVYPAAETYNEETLILLLDEAEEFYNECLGIGTE